MRVRVLTGDNEIVTTAICNKVGLNGSAVMLGPAIEELSDAQLIEAINGFAGEPGRLFAREGQTIVITPHPGEMSRLLGISVAEVQSNRLESARNLATTHRLHVVLKGHSTVIATPDGKVFINTTGNPGMATGGTGDVLTGMIAAWLAQLDDAEAACILGAYLHGAAGDLAAADESEPSMTAADLTMRIGDAILELTARRQAPTPPPR